MFRRLTTLLVCLALLAACQGTSGESTTTEAEGDTSTSAEGATTTTSGEPSEPVEIHMTFWGTAQEKEAVEAVAQAYMDENPGITVVAEHVPNDAYSQRITTMLASGSPPDLAYLETTVAEQLAIEGQLLDFTPYFEDDPEASQYLSQLQFHYDDVYGGDAIAGEAMILYYNKDLFDAAGLDYPPSQVENAWSWDEFVDVAKQLTIDRSGNDATSADFNSDDVAQYGVDFQRWWGGWMTAIYQGGNDFANEDGTALTINEPDAVDALQKYQDLIFSDNVAPPASVLSSSSSDALFSAGQLAMMINGHWKVLDFSQDDALNWGMAVLPVIGDEPFTGQILAPIVGFAATEHPDEVVEFYKFLRRPSEANPLYAQGLWMPVSAAYYEDPDLTAQWLDAIPGVYPEEARDVLIDYVPNYSQRPLPTQWLKNLGQIQNEAIQPAIDLIWAGEATAQEAMDQAVETAAPLMQGRWDR